MHTMRLLALAGVLALGLVPPVAAASGDAIRVALPCDVAFATTWASAS
jgi:hypothetical protein